MRRLRRTKIVATLGPSSSERAVIEQSIAHFRSQLDQSRPSERDALRDRLARLQGSVAVIEAGGVTRLAAEERRARIADALAATRAAMEEGIVPGGGVALLRAARSLSAISFWSTRITARFSIRSLCSAQSRAAATSSEARCRNIRCWVSSMATRWTHRRPSSSGKRSMGTSSTPRRSSSINS